MFVVWGRRITRKRLGYVADFCPVCRVQRAFELQAVRSTRHVYYLSLSRGQIVGYERKCRECGTSFKANAAAYTSVSKTCQPLEELKQLTFPTLDAATQEQLQLEERIRRQRLSSSERHALIKAPFLFLSPKVERRFSSTHIDGGVGLALIAAIALLLGAPLAGKLLPDSGVIVFVIALAIGLALVIWQVVESGSRFMRKEIVPVLAKSLEPLRPTSEELQAVLGELKQVKQKIGRKLKASELIDRMNAAPSIPA